MATPKWEPAKLYPPGSLVVPRTAVVPGAVDLTNPGFESGGAGWGDFEGDPEPDWTFKTGSEAYTGTGYAEYSDSTPSVFGSYLFNDAVLSVAPGTVVTASGYFAGNGPSGIGGHIAIVWVDQAGIGFKFDTSPNINTTNGNYVRATITKAAPAGAVTARIAVGVWTQNGGRIRVDNLGISYVPHSSQLQYKAVQPLVGFSDSVEPVWPQVLGQTVIDNEVIWEAVSISRLVWEAKPILKSGAVEPTWPTEIGDSVADGTISWTAPDPRTTDLNCPNSKVVVIAKFKVFAGDKDIVRYTATAMPQDWTTEKDAGYLGTGVQQNGANHVAVLGLYRANLAVMNATTFQQWAIDPDPALMDLLDTMDGIGSKHHLAAVPVGNDMLYLSNRGVRSIGVTGEGNNLRAGDVGLPVDPIVKALVDEAEISGVEPLGMYWPSMGQYWLSFNRKAGPSGSDERVACPTLSEGDDYAEVMVYTMTGVGEVGAWSRYIFPFPIDDWTQEGDDLYVRDGDNVYRISDDIGACDRFIPGDGYYSAYGEPFNAMIQWAWLDLGAPGMDKQMESFDIVGYGVAGIEIGYDQTQPGYFTPRYNVDPDTLRGTPVPMPLTAPSYSLRIRYDGWNPTTETGNETWGFNAFAMNFS